MIIHKAEISPPPPFLVAKRPAVKGGKGNGVRYERKAQVHLQAMSEFYTPAPWIRTLGPEREQWHQPDGWHFDFSRGVITIIEIKYRHCIEACLQLQRYKEVCQVLFPEFEFRLVEVVRWFEPSVLWPTVPELLEHPFKGGDRLPAVYILSLR